MIRVRTAVLILLLLAAFAAAADAPKLVVVISIDQFRYDYLERFQPWFGKAGFNRFLNGGADFVNANYRHAITFTGPGHASIGTGRVPAENGIVGNTWFERDAPFDETRWNSFFDDTGGYPAAKPAVPRLAAATKWYRAGGGSPRYCAFDERTTVTAGRSAGMSPALLASDSLGDRLKEKYGASRVIAVALKDRAAILMGGRKADAAYWFDYRLPGFVSSSYYRYDPAVFDFNQRVMSYVPASKEWQPSGLIPPADLKQATFDPPEAWKLKNPKYGTTFPHPITDARSLTYTPYGNDLLVDFALRVVNAEQLGKGSAPDLLYVGFSTPDYLGHYYGPDSMEVADDAVRLDRSLERFIDVLQKQAGDGLFVAITADHGVQPMPEIAKLRNPSLDAGRVDLRNARESASYVDELPPLRVELEREIARRLNIPFATDEPLTDDIIYFFEEPAIYLNWPRIRALKLDGERVKNAVRDALLAFRASDGVDRVYVNTDLLVPNEKADEQELAVRASFRADRSGDLIATLRQNWIWSYSEWNTQHGQPLPADQHVPLLLWGETVTPGRYADRVAPTDLARTIGALFGVEAAGSYAQVLPCVKLAGARPAARADNAGGAAAEVFAAALQQVDPERKLTIVAGRDLTAAARAAAESVRTVVSADQLPQSAEFSLPPGHARVDAIDVNGNHATVRLWIGPSRRPQPGVASLDCGTGRTLNFEKDAAGAWVLKGMAVAVC